jgi:DNA-binding Lrp family transcriptional regulator
VSFVALGAFFIGGQKMSEIVTRNRSLGPAASRLIKALAEESPRMLTRDELLESEALKAAYGKIGDASLDAKETTAAAKTLGRLIGKGEDAPIREVLAINRKNDDMPTKEVGLIGVSINLDGVREMKKAGNYPSSQEEILEKIAADSHIWGQDTENSQQGFPLAYVTGLYILHCSQDYDIIMFVNYSDMETYTRYIREVIQSIGGVGKTHTMQVAYGITHSPFF